MTHFFFSLFMNLNHNDTISHFVEQNTVMYPQFTPKLANPALIQTDVSVFWLQPTSGYPGYLFAQRKLSVTFNDCSYK